MTTAPTAESVVQYRSVLFVDGLALQGLPSALATDADAICIDIEDAVPPDRKAEARGKVLQLLPSLNAAERRRIIVRINSLRSLHGLADIQAFLIQSDTVAALVLPKVQTEDELRWAETLADDAGSSLQFICIIETNEGLENCGRIARGHSRLLALFFGGFDMSSALGSDMAWGPLLYARARVVHAAAGGNVQVIDSPYPCIDDTPGLRAAAAQAKALGMSGKTTKYPSQVADINAAFTPSEEEIDHARRAVAEFTRDPTRPVIVDGKMLELPSIKRLQRLLARFD